jgi:hypothetical protein
MKILKKGSFEQQTYITRHSQLDWESSKKRIPYDWIPVFTGMTGGNWIVRIHLNLVSIWGTSC